MKLDLPSHFAHSCLKIISDEISPIDPAPAPHGIVLWFTGLPGSGKSTLAEALKERLGEMNLPAYVLDGDAVRLSLNADLGFSPEDRCEGNRRLGAVASILAQAGLVAIVAAVSPHRAGRAIARRAAGPAFHEIHIKAPVEVCEQRDPKGLYALARAGKIAEFTGVSAPYESPNDAALVIETDKLSIEQSLDRLMAFLQVNLH